MMDTYFEPACWWDDYPHECPHCHRVVYFEWTDDDFYCPECGQSVSESEDK